MAVSYLYNGPRPGRRSGLLRALSANQLHAFNCGKWLSIEKEADEAGLVGQCPKDGTRPHGKEQKLLFSPKFIPQFDCAAMVAYATWLHNLL